MLTAVVVRSQDPAPVPIQGDGTTRNVSLCVGIQRVQNSIDRGQAASWIVSAWTKGGNVRDAIVRLVIAPSSLSPRFSFGCGSHDGTASCDLGEIAAQSVRRELQAQVVVPITATTVTAVRLEVMASAAHLPKDPAASATVSVKAAPAPGTGSGGGVGVGGSGGGTTTTTSPLPVGSLPFVDTPSATLSPGGNAAGLFPTVSPSPDSSPNAPAQQKAKARTVANTSALPLGAPVVGAQLIGLSVLALAFILAVTRLSIRRRPIPNRPAASSARPKDD